MPWCHECETEYVDGIEKCPDCGSALTDELPPSMLPKPKLGWSFKREKGVSAEAQWPTDSNGENIAAAFLTNVAGTQAEYELALSLLRSFNIPYACEFTGMGQISKVYTGFSSSGMDIYVPVTMLEDANNILFGASED